MSTAAHRQYCTYFDRNYLVKGLALYRSLERTSSKPFALWIACFDEETFDLLTALRLPHARLVRGAELLQFDPELAASRANRSLVEFYWTSTPVLPRFVLDREPSAEVVGYLDADLFFFSDPEALHTELGARSILVAEHGFAAEDAHLLKYGRFNVGALLFRRDAAGQGCLATWRAQCLAWCRAVEDAGRYGDQKYLDEWPQAYGEALAIARSHGIGVAPWNFPARSLEPGNPPRADSEPVVFVHFSSLAILSRRVFKLEGHYRIPDVAKVALYAPYVTALAAALGELRRLRAGFSAGVDGVRVKAIGNGIRRHSLLIRFAGRLLRS